MVSDNIYQEWLALKRVEASAAKERREIEDKIFIMNGLNEGEEGVNNFNVPGHSVKITQRLTRSVDADELQQLAAEAGLSEHLATLFRWKPSLDMNRWKATAEEITAPLQGAITTKAGRPSFSITKIED
jgi:hypothetical protein